MRKIFLIILVVLSFPFALYGQENAAESKTEDAKTQPKINDYDSNKTRRRSASNRFKVFHLSVHSDFASRYVWNGLPFSEGAVWQPSFNIEYQGFGASIWTNFVMDDEPNQGQINEIDVTGYYSRKISKLEIDVSLTYSFYPNPDPASLNFGPPVFQGELILTYPVGPIDLFSNLYVSFINPGGGVFWRMGVGYKKELPLHFSLSTYAQFGLSNGPYNTFYIAPVGIRPNLFQYTLAFPWSPLPGFIVRPQMNVSAILAEDLRSALPNPTLIWGVLTLSYNL